MRLPFFKRRTADAPPEQPPRPAARKVIDGLFTCNSYPIHYLSITKCGCTFVKNLLWHFDHGAPHPAGSRIHDHNEELPRRPVHEAAEMAGAPYAFVVIRKPVDRFLSLYFDKVVGEGHKSFIPLRARLIEQRGLDPDPQTAEAHRQNLDITLGWIEDTFARRVKMPVNAHWRRQEVRLRPARVMDLKVLTLDGLDGQLRVLLGGLVPDLDAHLAGASARNSSVKTIPKAELLDEALTRRVKRLYRTDAKTHAAAAAAWASIDLAAGPDPDAVPRLSQIGA